MKLTRILSLLLGAALGCHLPVAIGETASASAASSAASNTLGISPASRSVGTASSSSKAITLTLPAGTRTETLKAVLNGHDVSTRFAPTSCEGAVCEEATLTSSDGLLDNKNVLYAVAKKSDGTLASSRLRFVGNETQVTARAAVNAPAPNGGLGAVNSSFPTASNFIPPSAKSRDSVQRTESLQPCGA